MLRGAAAEIFILHGLARDTLSPFWCPNCLLFKTCSQVVPSKYLCMQQTPLDLEATEG